MRGEVAGYAHATDISEPAIRRAVKTARLAVGEGGAVLADSPQPTNRRLYTDADPIGGVSFPVKIETLRAIMDTGTSATRQREVRAAAQAAGGDPGKALVQHLIDEFHADL